MAALAPRRRVRDVLVGGVRRWAGGLEERSDSELLRFTRASVRRDVGGGDSASSLKAWRREWRRSSKRGMALRYVVVWATRAQRVRRRGGVAAVERFGRRRASRRVSICESSMAAWEPGLTGLEGGGC